MSTERPQSMPPGSVTHVGSFNWPTGVGPVPYLGAAAPPGWYMLKPGQGFQLEPIADYPSLFDLWGTRWGGDGVTTFGIPQAGWFTRGADGTHALWATFGEDAHQLTAAELASHGHTGHGTVHDPGHTHALTAGGDISDPAGYPQAFADQTRPNTPGVQNAVTGITVDVAVDAAGGDQPHNNVPKTLVVNLIIKT